MAAATLCRRDAASKFNFVPIQYHCERLVTAPYYIGLARRGEDLVCSKLYVCLCGVRPFPSKGFVRLRASTEYGRSTREHPPASYTSTYRITSDVGRRRRHAIVGRIRIWLLGHSHTSAHLHHVCTWVYPLSHPAHASSQLPRTLRIRSSCCMRIVPVWGCSTAFADLVTCLSRKAHWARCAAICSHRAPFGP